jgi:hypothetical protein
MYVCTKIYVMRLKEFQFEPFFYYELMFSELQQRARGWTSAIAFETDL